MTEDASLRPLRIVVLGLLLVVVDIRFESFDIIPDPLGWVLAALAVATVAQDEGEGVRAFRAAAVIGILAALLSVPDWLGPTGDALEIAGVVAHTAFVFATCTAIRAASPAHRPTANAIRWLDLLLAALLLGVGYGLSSDVELNANAAVPVLVLGVLTIGVFLWFLVLLFSAARTTQPLEV